MSLKNTIAHHEVRSKLISAKNWATRWCCSVSTVRRAAERFGVPRLYLGTGRKGLIRYDLAAIEEIERRAGVKPKAPARGRAEASRPAQYGEGYPDFDSS